MSLLLLRILMFLTAACSLAGCRAYVATSGHSSASPIVDARSRAVTSDPNVSSTRSPVYVAIGASDTFGYGVPDPATEGWVPRFATNLPAGTQLVNLGVVGLTLHQALLVDLPVALDAHPDVVTVWLVVNDLVNGVPLTSYQADLRTLLLRLRHGTHARILVGDLPDLTLVPAVASRLGNNPAATVAAWNAAIATTTRSAGATLVDLHTTWRELAAHPEYIGPDGLHPSIAGYARLAQIFAAAL